MFKPPVLPNVLVYFGPLAEVEKLHAGQSFSDRLEQEIKIHEGQIEAENILLNTVAHYQHIADAKGISREDLGSMMREARYNLDAVREKMMAQYKISSEDFDRAEGFQPVDTKDYMRARAAMMGAVLSSTPVLLRDPWRGKPVTPQYGFSDFKAVIGGVSFSAIATPRYKGIPFRFAVMRHDHDGYSDNNPAMMFSEEFCDAFALYNQERFDGGAPECNPLLTALATNLKPNIHDRFHNWLLYDLNAATEVFQQWGNDIYFVEHADKNPLLINYEQVALCFHLYTYHVLFEKNPTLKDQMYQRLEGALKEIKIFGEFLRQKDHPKADAIEESTVYAVLSNICFVLNPFEGRFQNLLTAYPDVAEKLLHASTEGKGIGATLKRLHGFDHAVPSQKYHGGKEWIVEYILRYPLAEEIRARVEAERKNARTDEWQEKDDGTGKTFGLFHCRHLPPILQARAAGAPDPEVVRALDDCLEAAPGSDRPILTSRLCWSEEGYFFFRFDRNEIDYTAFEQRAQEKKVLLVDVADGETLTFSNEKKLSLNAKVKKQTFFLEGGKDILAINLRDEDTARQLLAQGKTEKGFNAQNVLAAAQNLARMTGNAAVGDIYKIGRDVARHLYGFQDSGFYHALLEKRLARSPGPAVMSLISGGDQRLIRGALVYLPMGKNVAEDADPDCHFIENVDFKRDYQDERGTDGLCDVRFRPDSPLMRNETTYASVMHCLKTLHQLNFQVTHGKSQAQKFALQGKGLFS